MGYDYNTGGPLESLHLDGKGSGSLRSDRWSSRGVHGRRDPQQLKAGRLSPPLLIQYYNMQIGSEPTSCLRETNGQHAAKQSRTLKFR